MRRALVLLALVVLAFSVVAATAGNGGDGPAPDYRDGIPDETGFDVLPGRNGEDDPFAPAPQAGDGVPDGSGLESPNGPTAR